MFCMDLPWSAAASGVTFSRLTARWKLCIETVSYNRFSARQIGLPQSHLFNACILTLLLPRLCNVICGLVWSCQWNTSALLYLNSSTVALCVALSEQWEMGLSSVMWNTINGLTSLWFARRFCVCRTQWTVVVNAVSSTGFVCLNGVWQRA